MNHWEWLAYAFIMPGLFFAGQRKQSWGWFIQSIGCAIFVVEGIYFQIWGIAFANVIFGTIGFTNWWALKKKK